MSWYVYIVQCSDGTLYTGCTPDIAARLQAHNSGKGAKYTRHRAPVILRYQETHPDRSTAQQREYALKQLSRIQKLALFS